MSPHSGTLRGFLSNLCCPGRLWTQPGAVRGRLAGPGPQRLESELPRPEASSLHSLQPRLAFVSETHSQQPQQAEPQPFELPLSIEQLAQWGWRVGKIHSGCLFERHLSKPLRREWSHASHLLSA